MNQRIHLTDAAYAPEHAYEFTDTTEKIISYLEKDVRMSLHPEDPGHAHVDAAIAALRAGDLNTADEHANHVDVFLHTPEIEDAINGTLDLRKDNH